jgi:transposase
MKVIHKNSAGLDLGSQFVFLGLADEEVVRFPTFTEDFKRLAQHLIDRRIETVAMEATGVYWVVLHDILTKAGLDVWLVDGRQTKQVPGRKTDVKDCQWIQELHSYGLLNRCFVAEGTLKELRSYQRQREDHIRSSTMHINKMQKALIEMNIRLPEVLSQVHGASGMAIIEAILAGERDRHKLLSLCHQSIIKKKSDQVLKALEGFYTPAGLFALQQGYDAYRFYQKQIDDCDKAIEKVLQKINRDLPHKEVKKKRKPIRHHKPKINRMADHLLELFSGKDATKISGITDYTWLQLYSEMGNDLTKWPSEKHYTSWLGLSPGQHNSGKKKGNRKKGRPKAGQIFRTMAQSLLESKNIGFGAFGRRLRGRRGAGIAIKATARKLAIQYWRLMVKGEEFFEYGVQEYERKVLEQKQKYLNRLALECNVELVPLAQT